VMNKQLETIGRDIVRALNANTIVASRILRAHIRLAVMRGANEICCSDKQPPLFNVEAVLNVIKSESLTEADVAWLVYGEPEKRSGEDKR
jgi:hypothetical protein